MFKRVFRCGSLIAFQTIPIFPNLPPYHGALMSVWEFKTFQFATGWVQTNQNRYYWCHSFSPVRYTKENNDCVLFSNNLIIFIFRICQLTSILSRCVGRNKRHRNFPRIRNVQAGYWKKDQRTRGPYFRQVERDDRPGQKFTQSSNFSRSFILPWSRSKLLRWSTGRAVFPFSNSPSLQWRLLVGGSFCA